MLEKHINQFKRTNAYLSLKKSYELNFNLKYNELGKI